ncbi:WD40 repeat-like protein [Rickenella mellea]|uniref:WD40 repeat-like protein n=1 Tax=Rickenella mellea TaxID=50990 RepID=A0A4R5XEU5_9AGAM|nr:WD40 repeat-like protein [Rickenella mellea]
MSSTRSTIKNGKDETEDLVEAIRPPSPPFHTTHAVRGVHAPSFSAFQPRDVKITSLNPVSHVSWSCDGRKLASVGIDKAVRLWSPEKSLETRTAVQYSSGHELEVDYVTWNPTHPELFCSSSQKDRKVVFWDARQSRPTQSYTHHLSPTQLNYSPDGKTLAMITSNHQLYFMTYGAKDGETKQEWSLMKRDATAASTATFNHVGDGLILSHWRSNTLMIMEYPSLTQLEQPAAHVGGCMAIALDPRGKYLASGGHDSIVDLFDTSEWIICNTITACEHSINGLSFSHDGEYIAIASQGSYIDICATETTLPIHRVQTLGPAPTVTWHPSKYVIAYCGQTKFREGVPQMAFFSLFGPGM